MSSRWDSRFCFSFAIQLQIFLPEIRKLSRMVHVCRSNGCKVDRHPLAVHACSSLGSWSVPCVRYKAYPDSGHTRRLRSCRNRRLRFRSTNSDGDASTLSMYAGICRLRHLAAELIGEINPCCLAGSCSLRLMQPACQRRLLLFSLRCVFPS